MIRYRWSKKRRRRTRRSIKEITERRDRVGNILLRIEKILGSNLGWEAGYTG
jgi:hypothetical protein